MDEKNLSSIPTALALDTAPIDDFLLQILLRGKFLSNISDKDLGIKLLQRVFVPFLRIATILVTNGQTPASRVLGLNFVPQNKFISETGLQARLLVFSLLSVVMPTFHDSLVDWVQNTAPDDDNDQETIESMAQTEIFQRRLRTLARSIVKILNVVSPVARLCALLACFSGVPSASPSMLLSGFRYELKDKKKIPKLNVDYAQRRWVQREAIDAIKIMFAGLWLTDTWKPVFERYLTRPVQNFGFRSHSWDESKCPVCSDDLVIPFSTSCGHAHCYYCLQNEERKYGRIVCRVCSKEIFHSQPMYQLTSNS